ncbi:hypothetical protein QBC34DRAFT_470644 [Podospora aff. communis PSN243]|uniref:RING-type domain-containing protein n=1 Tax=Podospora aff. communis PSN243 TaxID=3040156 RepID=A0AAV9GDP4_9PEZI|nr:hypothetical protein QBC34DRAFT_470644 [Podospora aff. communis PSN243]
MSRPGRQYNNNMDDEELARAFREAMGIPTPPRSTSTRTPPAAPAASPSSSSESEEETLWSNIEAWLRDRRGPPPRVLCAICGEELIVPGLQENNNSRETMRVLPCGHVVGAACMALWTETRTNASSGHVVVKCPFCRAPVSTVTGTEGSNPLASGEESPWQWTGSRWEWTGPWPPVGGHQPAPRPEGPPPGRERSRREGRGVGGASFYCHCSSSSRASYLCC